MADLNSVFTTMGASNHSSKEREFNDYYATDPKALQLFLEQLEKDGISLHKDIWECATGENHLTNVLKANGFNVYATDIVECGVAIDEVVDFLNTQKKWNGDIVTNPPYKCALPFAKKALETIDTGNHVVMFLKIQFLEGKARGAFYKDNNPKYVYVSSQRLTCAPSGDFTNHPQSAICYAWFIWQKGFKGDTIVRWFN